MWVSLFGLRVSADMGPAFLRNRPGLARTYSIRKKGRCVPTSKSSKKTDVWELGTESAWHVDPLPLVFEWDWESFLTDPVYSFDHVAGCGSVMLHRCWLVKGHSGCEPPRT